MAINQLIAGATMCFVFLASSASIPSSSIYEAWYMTSTPCFTHIFIESLARACAHSLLPSECASSTHAAVSSSVK